MDHVRRFLEEHSDKKSPLLVGFSGGTDSKALLYALIEWGGAPIEVAHIDHGWRKESAEEATLLRIEIERLGLPFHTIRLEPEKVGNLEADAREKRLLFFKSLFEKKRFQALLLAHHRDDWAETALKRVFEGAHLPFLGGMKQISSHQGMEIWRPLLSVNRAAILEFLKAKELSFIDDPTNRDPAFLRARMRMEIFPYLSRTFGKNISENLSLLAVRANELREYLDRKIETHPILKGPWGVFFELPSERIEARHLLQKWTELPRNKLEEIIDQRDAVDWQADRKVFVDRGKVFILRENPPVFKEEILLSPGQYRSGDWEVIVEKGDAALLSSLDWRDVWSGRFTATVSGEGYSLLSPPPGLKIKKVWSECRVPSFLRFQVPVLAFKGEIVKEFLSGRLAPEKGESKKVCHLKISISYTASSSGQIA